MKNKLLITFVFSLLLLSSFSLTSAYFTRTHLYWTINSLEQSNSPIALECKDRMSIVLDGNTASDVPVLHYFDDEFTSYLSTHTLSSGYTKCLEVAGGDLDQRCFCYGVALHNVQDHFSHTSDGLTPRCIERSFATNLGGHMVCEKDYEIKLMQKLKDDNDPILVNGELDYYDSIVLNNLLPQEGGDEKYVNTLEEMMGINPRNDINIFANGYKGSGFYATVYGEKLNLPSQYFYWIFGIIIVCFGMMVILLFGNNKIKYVFMIPWLIMLLLGVSVLIAYQTNNTWQYVSGALRVPATLGILKVTDVEVNTYNDIVLEKSKEFWDSNGELIYADNTGLSYTDLDGKHIEGALIQAQSNFKYIILPILGVLFALYLVTSIYFSYRLKRRRR